jgi:hypothetical protein
MREGGFVPVVEVFDAVAGKDIALARIRPESR